MAATFDIATILASSTFFAQTHQSDTIHNDSDINTLRGQSIEVAAMTPAQLEDMLVVDARGEDVGEIDDSVADRVTGERFAVIEVGGFWGFGSKEVLAPLSELKRSTGREQLIVERLLDEPKSRPDFDKIEVQ